MDAYSCRCAICQLAHSPLLDAAHIIPDSENGNASVSNGLALCKIHHAAYDNNIIGITPDLVVQVNRDALEETDGPMLLHGIQEFHGQRLMVIPKGKRRPDRDFLATRFDRFLQEAQTV